MLAILNRGKYFLTLFIFIYSCTNKNINNEKLLKTTTIKIVGEVNYKELYSKACDSINSWTTNKLGYFKFCGVSKNCLLDSLICINSSGTRLIGCILKQQLLEEGVADDIDYFYGEKINNNWVFFTGPNIFIPRSMIENQNIHRALSFQQLHQIALKEVYSGYFDPNGNINEKWFNAHFEGSGWGGFVKPGRQDDPFLHGAICNTKKEYYEAVHLQSAKNNWLTRDTTQPVIPLPQKNLP